MDDKDSTAKKGPGGWQGSPASLKNLRRGNESPPAEEPAQEVAEPSRIDFDRHHRDVVWVYDHPNTKTAHPVRKQLQKEFKGDFKSFWAKVEKARAYFAGPVGGDGEWNPHGDTPCPTCQRAPEPPDVGSERALGILEQLLDDCAEEEAAKDAKLALRPDAANIGASLQNALNSSLEREKGLRERLAQFEGRRKP